LTFRTRPLLLRLLRLSRPPNQLFRSTALAIVLLIAGQPAAQQTATALVIMSRESRRAVPITVSGGQEMVALDDLATVFQLAVREERDALTVSYKGRTIVLTPSQAIASVGGRLIALPAPPVKVSNRWLVALDFISRALLPVYDVRLELRRPSRLLIVGDLRVPRVTIRPEQIGASSRVTIESTPPTQMTVAQDGTQRLTVKFDADAIDAALPSEPAVGLLLGFRSVDATTIAVDLGARFASYRSSTQVVDVATRLVLDVLPATDPAPVTTQVDPPPEFPPLPPGQPVFRTIAIDAGHGGDDVGARGAAGTTEKDVTLAIARRLKNTVESRLGLRVIMTRDDDRAVPVTDRTAVANNSKANLLVSLHASASFRSNVAGASVYVAAFPEAAVGETRPPPERLPAVGGGYRDIELIPWNLAQIRHRQQSDLFARLLIERLQNHVPLGPRPLEHAPLRVLESANMPAVLVETAYLTNPGQEKQLASEGFQQALVEAIVDTVVRFRTGGAGSDVEGR
jgi:N-acetylmuramoyl-L-alanine amidase